MVSASATIILIAVLGGCTRENVANNSPPPAVSAPPSYRHAHHAAPLPKHEIKQRLKTIDQNIDQMWLEIWHLRHPEDEASPGPE